MLRGDTAVGALTIRRSEVKPFTDKEVELVETFAAQAVIAIENARLLKELRQRTDDLTESLEQQTATADVLPVIGSSPGELESVFQTILQNGARLCEVGFFISITTANSTPSRRTTCRRHSSSQGGADHGIPVQIPALVR
jgi:GAF domain-containing protein